MCPFWLCNYLNLERERERDRERERESTRERESAPEREGELVAFLMSCDCYCSVVFLTVPWVGLQCVIVVFSDHTNFFLVLLYRGNEKSVVHFLNTMNSHSGFVLFVCIVALRPKSTAMVMAGRSVHLTTLFPGQA